jgi:hypothetical protein
MLDVVLANDMGWRCYLRYVIRVRISLLCPPGLVE